MIEIGQRLGERADEKIKSASTEIGGTILRVDRDRLIEFGDGAVVVVLALVRDAAELRTRPLPGIAQLVGIPVVLSYPYAP